MYETKKTEKPQATLSTPTEVTKTSLPPTDEPEVEPYIPPILTDIKDFEFGRYMLMTEELDRPSGDEYWTKPVNEFLGQGVDSIEAGQKIYDKLNSRYCKEYPIEAMPDFFPRGIYTEEEYIDRFFRRKVEIVSTDGKRVLCSTLLKNDNGDWNWDSLEEVFEGEKLVASYESRSLKDIVLSDRDRDSLVVEYTSGSYGKTKYIWGLFGNYISSDLNQFIEAYHEKELGWIVDVHSLKTGEVIESYLIDHMDNRWVCQYTNDGKLLTWEWRTEKIYLSDLDGTNEVCLGSYMFDPLLSPDGRFLAYRGPDWSEVYETLDMPMGFYIKNLETGETVSYPSQYTDYQILGWVERDGLMELLKD